MKYLSSIKLVIATAVTVFAVTQNAIAATTLVTDAIGTKEKWTFDEVLGAHKLTSKTNQFDDGKGITQTWDANGNKLTHTDAEGRTTKYTYNATNQRDSMTEAFETPQARTTTYEYLSADIDLVTKTTSPSIYASNDKEVINTYDERQNITKVTINGFDAQGLEVSRVTTFDHDQYGKVTLINGPLTDVDNLGPLIYVDDITILEYYDCSPGVDCEQLELYDCNTGAECGQLKKVTNALGHVSTYDAYDAASRLKLSTDPNGVVTSYDYHPRGWLLKITQTPPLGQARITTYDYDNAGQLKKVTLADGSEQNYEYNDAHDLEKVFDNLGNKVEYTYDPKGNRTHTLIRDPNDTLVRRTITTYNHRNFIQSINNAGSLTQLINDAVGNLSTQTDPKENPDTSNTFDALDRLSNTVDALNNNSTYAYDVADQLSQVTSPNGSVTQYEYDDLGNQTKEISIDRDTLVYSHDGAGNVLTMTDARSVTASYTYDALNRLTSVSYPQAGENISYSYDLGANCGFSIGRLCQIDDAMGTHFREYDPWGNVLSQTWQTDTSTFSLTYTYDALNRVSQISYPSGLVIDYVRDAIGRVEAVHSPSSSRTEIIADQFSYRADGLIKGHRLGNAQVTQRSYDLQGRLESQSIDGIQIASYDYDANGNVLQKNDADHQRTYGYDVLDRLKSDDWLGGLLSNDWHYTYDANGNRKTQKRDQQSAETITYATLSNVLVDIGASPVQSDFSGNITNLPRSTGALTLSYNQQNHLAEVTRSGIVTNYGYNHQRQRLSKQQGVDVSHYLYDLNGRLVATLDDQGTVHEEYVYANEFEQTPIQHRLYDDTEDNTVESRQALTKSEALIADPVNGQGQCEGYERTEAERTNSNALFDNNTLATVPVGNEVFMMKAPRTDVSAFIPILFLWYFDESEQAADPIDITTTESEVDNTQIEIVVPTEPEGDALDYIVDVATTKRSLNNGPDIARHCIQQGQTSVNLNNLPLNGTNIYIRVWSKKANGDWVYEDYELETEAKTPATKQVTRSYIVSDHLDTPRFIYDDEKVLTWRWASDGFGRQAANDDPDDDGYQVNFNLGFPGQYDDLESGLVYNWNRYYDPNTGRYVTSDPIGLGGGLNTYGYVGGNPVNSADPTGLVCGTGACVVAYAVSTAVARQAAINAARSAAARRVAQGVIDAAAVGVGTGVLPLPGSSSEDTEGNGGFVDHPDALREYQNYKDALDALMPPGLDPCEELRWKLNREIEALNARAEWDQRWNPYRHAATAWQSRRAIRNIRKRMKEAGCDEICEWN